MNQYKLFCDRYNEVEKVTDKELRNLSYQDKFKQLSSLIAFAAQMKMTFPKKHVLNNWTKLKAAI